MKKLISMKLVLDEELDGIVGGDVLPNNGTNTAAPNLNGVDNANTNAAFNRPATLGTECV